MLMEAVDAVEAELSNSDTKPNPKMLGLTPLKYFLRCLRQVILLYSFPSFRLYVLNLSLVVNIVVQVKAADLENALLIMPFHYVERFVKLLLEVIK